MTKAEILTIGTELLLGEIVDTNTRLIARALRETGLDLFRTATVGDNRERIAQAVSDALKRSDLLITSGGLGPTVDDVTREGVAQALELQLEFREDMWEQIVERFKAFGREPTENNRRQAELPAGAVGVENPVGTAPAFIAEKRGKTVIALPGVPAELEYLLEHAVLPYLRGRQDVPAVIKTRTVRTAGAGESWIDERIDDLERMPNPTVGLAAHPGRVDIRITAKAGTEMEADELLWGVEATIRQRLGDRIYGTDDQTLESVVLDLVGQQVGRLAVVESGTDSALARALAGSGAGFAGGSEIGPEADEQQLVEALEAERRRRPAEAGLGLALRSSDDRVDMLIVFRSAQDSWQVERSYGGPPPNAAEWAVSLALDQLRRRLLDTS